MSRLQKNISKRDSTNKASVSTSPPTLSSEIKESSNDSAGTTDTNDNDGSKQIPSANKDNMEDQYNCTAAFDIDSMLSAVEDNPSLHSPLLQLSHEFIDVLLKQNAHASEGTDVLFMSVKISHSIMKLAVNIPLQYWMPTLPPEIYNLGKEIDGPYKVVFKQHNEKLLSVFFDESANTDYFQLMNDNFCNEVLEMLRQIQYEGQIDVGQKNVITVTALKRLFDKYSIFSLPWCLLLDIILNFLSLKFIEPRFRPCSSTFAERIEQLHKFIGQLWLKITDQLNEQEPVKKKLKQERLVQGNPISEQRFEKYSNKLSDGKEMLKSSRSTEPSNSSGITAYSMEDEINDLDQRCIPSVSESTFNTLETTNEKTTLKGTVCSHSLDCKCDCLTRNKLTQFEIYLGDKFLPAVIKLYSPEAIKNAKTTLENLTEDEIEKMNENREKALSLKRFVDVKAYLLNDDSLKTKTISETYTLEEKFKKQLKSLDHYWKKRDGNTLLNIESRRKPQENFSYPNPAEIRRPWRGINALTCIPSDLLKEATFFSKHRKYLEICNTCLGGKEEEEKAYESESDTTDTETCCSYEDLSGNVEVVEASEIQEVLNHLEKLQMDERPGKRQQKKKKKQKKRHH